MEFPREKSMRLGEVANSVDDADKMQIQAEGISLNEIVIIIEGAMEQALKDAQHLGMSVNNEWINITFPQVSEGLSLNSFHFSV